MKYDLKPNTPRPLARAGAGTPPGRDLRTRGLPKGKRINRLRALERQRAKRAVELWPWREASER